MSTDTCIAVIVVPSIVREPDTFWVRPTAVLAPVPDELFLDAVARERRGALRERARRVVDRPGPVEGRQSSPLWSGPATR